MTLLQVRGLTLHAGGRPLVDDLSFAVAPGEALGLVGESGAGKTLAALSLLGLLPPGVTRVAGAITLAGVEVTTARPAALRRLRGGVAGMIFQEPLLSLNPLHRVGRQVAEAIALHAPLPRGAARAAVLALLREVGLAEAERLVDTLPHLLSGGQRQRVMIAVALAGNPRLLIADEPTTALDVTLQSQVMALIERQRRARGLALLLISHDPELVRRHADRVVVLDRGRAVAAGTTEAVFAAPRLRLAERLLAARQPPPAGVAPAGGAIVLSARHLRVSFPVARRGWRRPAALAAVDDVSFDLRAGETLGLIGASGAGKSTLALAVLRLISFTGTVRLDGQDLAFLSAPRLRAARARLQILFQDPYASLAPRLSVGAIVGEGPAIHHQGLTRPARAALVAEALREVGLPAALAARYPHELSGGERQRVALARALILRPAVMVLDEPTSALDVTAQAEILALLRGLQARHGLAYLLISHDPAVIRRMAHRIIVLKDGRVVVEGAAESLFTAPREPYTRTLLAAAFTAQPDL